MANTSQMPLNYDNIMTVEKSVVRVTSEGSSSCSSSETGQRQTVTPRPPYCFRSTCHVSQRAARACPTQPCCCCSTWIGLPSWQPCPAKTGLSCPMTPVDRSAFPSVPPSALLRHRMPDPCRQTPHCGGSSTARRRRRATARRQTTQDWWPEASRRL